MKHVLFFLLIMATSCSVPQWATREPSNQEMCNHEIVVIAFQQQPQLPKGDVRTPPPSAKVTCPTVTKNYQDKETIFFVIPLEDPGNEESYLLHITKDMRVEILYKNQHGYVLFVKAGTTFPVFYTKRKIMRDYFGKRIKKTLPITISFSFEK